MTRHGPLISTNVLQVNMQYKNSDTNMENVYHVHKPSAWVLGEVDLIVSAFETWENTSAKPQRGAPVSLVRITATDLTSLGGARVDSQLVLPIVGTHDGGLLPANATIAVKGNTGKRGRGRQGRTFWIGLTDTMVVADTIDAGSASAIESALAALLLDVPAAVGGAGVCIIHQFINGVWQADAPADLILEWAITDLTMDSQRDRLPAHKRRKSKPVA